VIVYVHLNPFLHGVRDDFDKFPYSSYAALLQAKSEFIRYKEVIELFGGIEN
jgi:hypothetical protein